MTGTGIVLAQMGGPADLEAVEPFIRSIFGDRDVVPTPGPAWVGAAFGRGVAKLRGPRVRASYRLIGGGSPIRSTTIRQANLLTAELARRGRPAQVAVAMRYTDPGTAAAVEQLARAGVDEIVLLALYPHYSFATTGSAENELLCVIAQQVPATPLKVIRTWHDHPSYLDLQARLVTEMIDELPRSERENAAVVFSAHGLPKKLVARGDPYPDEIQRSVAGVVRRLPYAVDARLAYQSRSGPISWIGPDTRDVIADFGREGRRYLCLVPISFVSDHIETLHEADIVLRASATDAGIDHYRRSAVFNDMGAVGPMLADIIEDRG